MICARLALVSLLALGACGGDPEVGPDDTGAATGGEAGGGNEDDTGGAEGGDPGGGSGADDTGEDCPDPQTWYYDADGDGFGD